MRSLALPALIFLVGSSLPIGSAESGPATDIVLIDGTILKGARVTAIGQETVSIIDSTGATRVLPHDRVPLDVLGRAYIQLEDAKKTASVGGPIEGQSLNFAGPRDRGNQSPGSAVFDNRIALFGIAGITLAAIVCLMVLARSRAKMSARLNQLEARFRGVVDADAERERILQEIERLRSRVEESKRAQSESQLKVDHLRKQISIYEEDLELIDFGFYRRHYEFDISQRFKDAIEATRADQKAMVKAGGAFVESKDWTVNGSASEGRQMVRRYQKLMLKAFNGEADSIIANVSWNNVTKMEERLDAEFGAINKLGESQQIQITRDYFKLKLEELRLSYEYQEKLKAEKEEQRRIREQIREEERAQREIEQALKEAEDEEARYQRALERVREDLTSASGKELESLNRKVALLEAQLDEARKNKERAISRAQITKSGHVYVISNIGSFGENKFKIGMTRRLEPLERIKELGDASVPFDFDVHAVIYAEDAPALEARLHRHFEQRRVNLVNERKEFFDVSIEDIEGAVKGFNASIEIIKVPEARDYRQTVAARRSRDGAAKTSPDLGDSRVTAGEV